MKKSKKNRRSNKNRFSGLGNRRHQKSKVNRHSHQDRLDQFFSDNSHFSWDLDDLRDRVEMIDPQDLWDIFKLVHQDFNDLYLRGLYLDWSVIDDDTVSGEYKNHLFNGRETELGRDLNDEFRSMVDDRIEEVMGEGGFNTYVPQTRLESGEVVSCVRTRYSVLMWFVGRTKSLLEWSNSELHQPSLPRLYRRWGDRMGDEIVSNQRLWVRDLLDQEENELLSISTPPSWFTSFDWTTEEVTRV